ncbi:MAG: hypothetical protein WAM05_19825 [Candidatus Binataceae bacterium]
MQEPGAGTPKDFADFFGSIEARDLADPQEQILQGWHLAAVGPRRRLHLAEISE